MSRDRPWHAAMALAVGWASAAGLAGAHLVGEPPTLLGLVSGSERVARVRILDPGASVTLEASGARRPIIRAEVVEVLKGPAAPKGEIRFATHGHGVAEYAAGEEALIFLVPLERSKELSALKATGLRWVSLQEHESRFLSTDASASLVLDAARRYAAVSRLTEPEQRLAALREITLVLLTSGDARLGAFAIRDLVATRELGLVTEADVPFLLAEVVRAPKAPVAVRVGLLVELEARGLVDAAPQWEMLLRSTPEPELRQVVKAAGRHPSPGVDAILIGMLKRDAPLAEAAAIALGDPRHASAVSALASTLERPEPRVRMAAIRSLGGIGTPAAREALAAAAARHSDPATRRRAAAEVRVQSQRR